MIAQCGAAPSQFEVEPELGRVLDEEAAENIRSVASSAEHPASRGSELGVPADLSCPRPPFR